MVSFQTVPRSRGRCRKPARLSENLGCVRGQLKLFLIVLSILCFTFENLTTAAPPSSASQKLKYKSTPVINRNATAYYDALQRMLASAANFSSVCGKSTLNSTDSDVQGKAINLTKSNHKFYNDDDDEDGQGYRIISGLKAERGQFPWVVALRGIPFPFAILPMHLLKIPLLFARLSMGWLRPKFADAPLPKLILETLKSEGWFHFCGGTLVSDEWVLTAAHCFAPSVSQRLPPKYAITAGTVSWLDELGTRPSENADENNSGEDLRPSAMAEVHIHPLYLRDTYTHDIALVRLKYKLPIDKSRPDILPACLPPHTAVAVHNASITTVAAIKQQNSSSTVTSGLIAGWGIKHEKSLKVMNKQLRYTSVKLINDMKQCEQTLQTKMVRDATICAGNIYDQVDQMTVRDACQGDSGGPLTTFDTSTQRWTLSGIVSFGIGCGRIGMPSIYTNVSHYLSQTYDSLLNTTAAFKWN